ncbi:MAG: glycosyltransferase family 39 protein [Caulobacteraceae bacterium]|nr:glycosyltransferase family 39 protein [Caulobacteraceae bacterium]
MGATESGPPTGDRFAAVVGMTPQGASALKVGVLACLFVAAWTAIATLADGTGALHHDVVEAYVWGREFQLGYYKHPPFWAWLTGAWFLVFPRANWAANLLAMTNAAVGLVGAWALIGCFSAGPRRAAASLLLVATPFYTAMATRFNANGVFLSLWPWTLYAFVRSLDAPRPRERLLFAALFGVLVGAAGLSKYYALVLAAGCVLSLPLHPRGWAWLRSPAPWIAAAIAAAAVAPHLWWLVRTDFPPFRYFSAETGRSLAFSLGNVARMPLEWLAYHAIVILVAVAAAGTGPRAWARALKARSGESRFRFMAGLLGFPLLLTLVAGLAFRLKLSSNWTEAAFPLAPLLVLDVVGGDMRRIGRVAAGVAIGVTAAALALSPALGRGLFGARAPNLVEPRRELAVQADVLWRRTAGGPLRIVAGSFPYDEAIAFYAPDRPSVFIDFDPGKAPWITPARLEREGWLAACASSDGACLARAQALAGPKSRRFTLTLVRQGLARASAPVSFQLFVTPPGRPGG